MKKYNNKFKITSINFDISTLKEKKKKNDSYV